jgi:hypothetical protein
MRICVYVYVHTLFFLFMYGVVPLQGQNCKEQVSVEKHASQSLDMTDKVMTALKEKGEVDADLGIVVPRLEDESKASCVKEEKPSLEKLLTALKTLKSAYLCLQALHPRPVSL